MSLRLRSTLKPWCIVFITALFFFYEFGINNIFNVLEPHLVQAYHLSSTQMGFLSSLYLYANLIFLIPAGLILDRYSPRYVITSALFICGVGVALVAFSKALWVLAFARFLMGIGGGFCFVGCMRIAVNWLKSRYLASASGLIVTMGMLGGFLVQSPFAYLSIQLGWREAVALVALLGFIISFLIFFIVRDAPKDNLKHIYSPSKNLKPKGLITALKSVFFKKQNWACAIYGGCMNIPIAILGAVWGVPYLTHVYHLDTISAAGIIGMLFIGTLIGSPLMGYLCDRIQRRKPLMWIGGGLSFLLCFIMLLYSGWNKLDLWVIYFCLGLFTSSQVIAYPTVAESNSLKVAGSATSIISCMMVLGGILGQPLFGKLISWGWKGSIINGSPIYSALDFTRAMWVIPSVFILALLMVFFIKETYCKRSPDYSDHD